MSTVKVIFLLFPLLLLIESSCNRPDIKTVDVIKVNPEISDSVALSKVALNVNRILLETNESCLITRINEIEITDEFIFVNDAGKRVLQFNSSGKFIRQIGKQGRGPGEYFGIDNIAVGTDSTLYIATLREILCFDFDGVWVIEIKQDSFSEFISVVDNKLWTISTSFGNKLGNERYVNITKLIRYSLQDYSSDTLVVRKVLLSGITGTTFPQAFYISDLESKKYLYIPVLVPEQVPIIRDTLYEVKANTLIPSIKIDFGKEGEPKDGGKRVFIRNIYRTNNYLFTEYFFKGKSITFCHDFIRNADYNIGSGFIDDYYGTGIIQLRPLDLKNETVYFVKEAFYLADKMEGIAENSNPVIFIVKLKGK